MKIEIIERPSSTTYVIPSMFHLIKDKKEMENVMRGHTKDDIFVVNRWADQNTFQPFVAFAVRDPKKDYYYWLKFVCSHELIAEELDEKNLPPYFGA